MSKILPAAPLVLLAAGLLGACAPTAPPGPAPPAVAEAGPAAPTGDAALDSFLAALAANIDLQDWEAVADMLEPGASAEPRDRVIARALGLGGPTAVPLDAIRVVTFRSVRPAADGRYRIAGDVRRDDGATAPIGFVVERRPGGTFHVLVPNG